MTRGVLVRLAACGLLLSLPVIRTEAQAAPVTDPREAYTVGVSLLSAPGVDEENRYLASSIPRLLLAEITAMEVHRYGDAELEGYRRFLVSEAMRAAGRDLAELQRKRDALLFEQKGVDYREAYEDLTGEIREEQELLASLSGTDHRQVRVEAEKPIRLAEENQRGELLPSFYRPLPESGVDLLLQGSLQQVQEYLYITFQATAVPSGTVLFAYEDAVLPQEADQAVERLSRELATLLLGREWSFLTVSAVPEDAEISVNDRLLGRGEAVARYLPPGEARVRVFSDAGKTKRLTVFLQPFEEKRVEVSLETAEQEPVTVTSEPEPADVYLDALWMGQTPLTFPRPREFSQLTLQKEGYRSFRTMLPPEGPDRLTFSLLPLQVDKVELFRQRKDGFYRALTLFVLSVPVPIILYGLYDNYTAGQSQLLGDPDADPDELDRLQNARVVTFYGYLGGLALSGATLVNAVIQLRRYIRAGEALY